MPGMIDNPRKRIVPGSIMRFYRTSIILITFLCFGFGDDSLLDDPFFAVDSALSDLDMSRADLWMPWDVVSDDVHRLPVIKSLFAEPLNTFTLNRDWALIMQENPETFLNHAIALLQTQEVNTDSQTAAIQLPPVPDYKLNRSLKKGLNQHSNVLTDAVLQYSAYYRDLTAGIDSTLFQTVFSQADSMLLMSADSKELTVWELKEGEVEGNRVAREFFSAAADIDLDALLKPGLDLYQTITLLLDSLALQQEIVTKTIHTPMGDIRFGGTGDDIHQGAFAMILDFGGNDTYLLDSQTKFDRLKTPVEVIIDLSGDDRYLAGDLALGSAFFGSGILVDRSGDDQYLSGDFSQGSGLFGLGILLDESGNDTYSGKVCTQGSGAFGIGILLDKNGTDLYQSNAQAQGFGFTRGIGTLADFNGNDVYVTLSPFQDFLRYESHFVAFTQGAGLGYRPIASGGIGLLFDYQGNDSYQTDIYGQGTAYWYSMGAIYDDSGDDRYQAYQYAQGSGVHMAHAVILDNDGNDHYFSHGVSQGCGHDIAFGGLFDYKGDDEYVAESLSMGGGNADAVSILVDRTGNDAYIARQLNNMMGYSDFRRDYGMIGIFADCGGVDLYGSTAGNDTTTFKSTYGVFKDMELFFDFEFDTGEPLLTPADSLKIPLASTVDSLFIQASTAPQKFQYNVNPAREKIVNLGAPALKFLGSKLNTDSARERHALLDILKKMMDTDAILDVRDMVVDSLLSNDRATVSMAASVAGDRQMQAALENLVMLLDSPSWKTRALAALNLGKIQSTDAIEPLKPLLKDEHVHVRMRVSYAIARISPDLAIGFMPIILDDPSQLVRNSFFQGLKRSESAISMPVYIRSLQRSDEKTQIRLIELAPYLDETEKDAGIFREWTTYQDPERLSRISAVILASNSDFWKEVIYNINEPEKIPVDKPELRPDPVEEQ